MTKAQCLRKQFNLFSGLPVDKLLRTLARAPRMKYVRATVKKLKLEGFSVVVLSDNLTVLSDVFLQFGFDETLGSKVNVRRGVITKKLTIVADKLPALERYCRSRKIKLMDCIHVGDWDNDIPVFKAVGLPVAINPKNSQVIKNARLVVRGNNLMDVYRAIAPSL